MSKRGNPTADELRDAIDHGRGGDKVDVSDPAAAPLGTDAEAAGTPPTDRQLRHAWAAEIAGADRATKDASEKDRRRPEENQPRGRGAALLVVLAAMIALAVVWALFA